MEQWLKIKIMIDQVLEDGKKEKSEPEQSEASEDEEEVQQIAQQKFDIFG
jgi:hypothetical protein